MSYEKQTWATGDTITAEKLNHMEDGIAASGASYDLVLTYTSPETGDPILTGSGASPAELISKLDNGEMVNAKFWYNATQSTIDISHSCSIEKSNDGSVSIQVYKASGCSLFTYFKTVYQGETTEHFDVSGAEFSYSYNDGTKEYSFTFEQYLE